MSEVGAGTGVAWADLDLAASRDKRLTEHAHLIDDRRPDLWSVFNRTQENLTKGGLHGRSANGRRQQTRPIQGIDSDVRLNRALWMLADGLRQLKA